MDNQSLIAIIIGAVVLFFFVKFILSPIIRAVLGVLIFLIAIYLLQRFYNFNPLSPFGVSLDTKSWNIDWIFAPIGFYIDRIKSFIAFIWGNFPKDLGQ